LTDCADITRNLGHETGRSSEGARQGYPPSSVGALTGQLAMEMTLVSVDTFDVSANVLPTMEVPVVTVIAACASRVPPNAEFVPSVAALPHRMAPATFYGASRLELKGPKARFARIGGSLD